MDDFHRVLAAQVGFRLACAGVEGVDFEIGRDVAIQEVELKVHEDRLASRHLEAKPVEAGLPLLHVVEIVHVVGRSIHVSAQLQHAGLLPGIIGLGLDRRAVARGDDRPGPCHAHGQRLSACLFVSREHQVSLAVPVRTVDEVKVGISGMEIFLQVIDVGAREFDLHALIGGNACVFQADKEAVGFAGLDVAQGQSLAMTRLKRDRPCRRFGARAVGGAARPVPLGARTMIPASTNPVRAWRRSFGCVRARGGMILLLRRSAAPTVLLVSLCSSAAIAANGNKPADFFLNGFSGS